jgi:hypothetical protein
VAIDTSEGGGAVEFSSTKMAPRLRPPLTDRFELPYDTISPDWRVMASLRDDGRGELHDPTSLTKVGDLPPCTSPVEFSPDGSLLVLDARFLCTMAAGGTHVDAPPDADLPSRVLNVATGEVVLDLEDRLLGGSAFNPVGRFDGGDRPAVPVAAPQPAVRLAAPAVGVDESRLSVGGDAVQLGEGGVGDAIEDGPVPVVGLMECDQGSCLSPRWPCRRGRAEG